MTAKAMLEAGGPTSVTKMCFSASELAELDLPGLSPNRNRVVEMAMQGRWADQVDAAGNALAQPRAGRGGGWEYHFSLLPIPAQLELVKRGALSPAQVDLKAPEDASAATWSWFEKQPDKVKAEAQARLAVLNAVEAYNRSGLTLNVAVAMAASEKGIAPSSIWGWKKLVKGVSAHDWLPALAPRRKGGGVKADIDERILTYFKSFYLRPSPMGFEECYRQTVKEAKRLGVVLPSTKTLIRRLRAEVPQEVILLKRHGIDAVVETVPPQRRTRAHLHAMEAVNIDGHKWDVFVRFPEANGEPERVQRPISVVIQDLYSNKIVAWRTGRSESALMTRLVFGDLFREWGIPSRVTLDNGRAFASKWLTGGAKTRFRFKIREGDPLGLLTQLGVKTHWARPAHGQAKPIERTFRDLEQIICMGPVCQGAYTGHHPDAKPEDYGSRAIPLDVFESEVARGISEFNARQGRRADNAKGRSFDEVFFASYATAPIGKATDEQLRLALLTADQIRAHKKTGAVTLYGNTYYDRALYAHAGQMVTVRFDPEDLMKEVYVYRDTGELICAAPIQAAVGFYDVDAAKARARLEADLKRSVRAAAKLQGLISAADLAAQQLAAPVPAPTDAPTPSVVRPIRTRGAGVAAKIASPDRAAYSDRFTAAMERVSAAQERPKLTLLDGGLAPQSEPERPKT